eukprot:INCI14751.4.p1 GENE.INCI14751.4~~INCI14751.4.p1  ORF type:complete len:586 (+),score=158.25 INCI14751.4:736-2493(+)
MRKLILGEDPLVGRKTLDVLVELYKKRIWNDSQTINIVADGCFAKEIKICLACIRFFLGIDTDIAKEEEKEEQDHEDYNFSKAALRTHQHSKKTRSRVRHNEEAEKKKKKLRQRKAAGGSARKPLLKAIEGIRDPQTFAEKLFRILRSLKKIRFEEKLMFMDLVSRLIGVHRVLLFNFYSYIQNYLHAHQVEITRVLAILLQACHEHVTEDCVVPLVRTIADNFVRDRCGTEAITVGINAITGILMRVTHVLNSPELRALIGDLSQFKKSREKSVVVATRGFINTVREHHPTLLKKKDRGRDHKPDAKPLQYGEQKIVDKDELAQVELRRKEERQADRLGIDVNRLRKRKAAAEAAANAKQARRSENEGEGDNEDSDSDSDEDGDIALGPRGENEDGDEEQDDDDSGASDDERLMNDPVKGRAARRRMKRREAVHNVIGSDGEGDDEDDGLDDEDILALSDAEGSDGSDGSDSDDDYASGDDDDPTGLGGLFVHESQLAGPKARAKMTREERAINAKAGMQYTKTRGGGSTNKEKKRKKAFVMIKYSRAVRSKLKTDLQQQQKNIKARMKAIERAGSKKIKRGRR